MGARFRVLPVAAIVREVSDRVKFDIAIEAGFCHLHRDFRSLRLHTSPARRLAAEFWKASTKLYKDVCERPAYNNFLTIEMLDRYGITPLAGNAVGATFIGAIAASMVRAEVLRLFCVSFVHK